MARRSTLQSRAASARRAGISNRVKPKSPVLPCGKPQPAYEQCELKDLTLKLNDQGNKKTATVVLSERKIGKPVAPTVADQYVGRLGYFDLVVEAITGVEFLDRLHPLTNARATPNQAQVVTPSAPANGTPREGSIGLEMRAKATHKSTHTSFSPPHPRTCVGQVTEHSSAEVVKRVSTPPRNVGQNLLSIWPFHASRIYTVDVNASACGNSTAPNALKKLSILLVALPSEEVKISIKGPKTWGRSNSQVYNRIPNSDGVGGVRTVTQTRTSRRATETYSDARGRDYSSQTLSTVDRKGTGETITETQTRDRLSHSRQISERQQYVVGTRTISLTENESTDADRSFKDGSETAAAGITVTVKSAGEEASIDASGILDAIKAVKDIVKTVKEFFSGATVGWSVSLDFVALEGSLDFTWGLRWPETYVEEDRVYYVERYLTAAGDITLIQGKLEAKVGIEFEKGWCPVSVVAKAQLNLTLALKLAPSLEWKYTNPKRLGNGQSKASIALSVEFSVVPEVVGTAKVFGYKYTVRAAVEAKFTATATLQLTWENPPALEVDVKSDKIELTGYVECSTRRPQRVGFSPILLCNERQIYKNPNVWA